MPPQIRVHSILCPFAALIDLIFPLSLRAPKPFDTPPLPLFFPTQLKQNMLGF